MDCYSTSPVAASAKTSPRSIIVATEVGADNSQTVSRSISAPIAFPIQIGKRSLGGRSTFRGTPAASVSYLGRIAGVCLLALCGILGFCGVSRGADRPQHDPILATVDGVPIRKSDLDLACLIRGIGEADRPRLQAQLVEQLATQTLMANFLKQQRVEATTEEIDLRITLITDQIRQAGREPKEVFAKLGISEEIVRQTVALPLAWRRYARKTISDAQVEAHFEKYRPRFDGTRVHAAQIVLKRSGNSVSGDSVAAAEEIALSKRLETIRKQIVAGEITFADAAKQYSESPTASHGGDLGSFVYGAQVAKEIADAAFALKAGEISGVVLTRHGMHLVQVTKIEPGQYTLGDVRQEVLHELTEQLWSSQSESLRAEAKIEIKP